MKHGVVVVAMLAGCARAAPGVTSDARAEACGTCHAEQHAAWSTSPHAVSARSPVFQAFLPRVEAAWGEAARQRCEGCHAPMHGGDTGIGCVACHSAVGNAAERDGMLTVDLDAPVGGPFGDALPTPAHGSRASELLGSPILCGTCHEVTGPRLFVEPTLSEYARSRAAKSGVACVQCHMPEGQPGAIALGAGPVRARRDHLFAGFDPPWGAPPGEADHAAARSRALLAAALTIEVARAPADPEGNAAFVVTLANVGAGHQVPTGAAFLRRIWADVELVDARGTTETRAAVIELGTRFTRNGADVALPTDADSVEPRALDSGEQRTARVTASAGMRAPVRAVAIARGEAVRGAVLEALSLGARAAEVPRHEIARAASP